MTVVLLVRRFVDDYRRNGANLVVLALVPLVFVLVAADRLADVARLLGGADHGIVTVTAGWAAGFLAGIAMYFQVSAARATDRRLVLAGLPRRHLVTARVATCLVLGLVAATAALLALGLQNGLESPVRVITGTLMFAVIYLAVGAVLGATMPNPINGTAMLMFVWIIDVFFGPTMTSSESAFTRVLPTHFVSLWMVDQPTGHGGPGALAWGLTWTVGAVAVAVVVVAKACSVAHRPYAVRNPGSAWIQLKTALRMGWHDWRRTPVLWVLLAVVPAVFIWLSDVSTPSGRTSVMLRENGRTFTEILDPAHIHAATMAPIAVGSLAALAGTFIALDARSADRRLALAGQRRTVILATRMGMVLLAGLLAVAASVGVLAMMFTPHQWDVYVIGLVLVSATYGLIGAVVGPLLGRVSGTFMAFLIPFLDLGIGQSPMVQGEPAAWARFVPGYGSVRVAIDGALTSGFDEVGPLLIAVAWIVALVLLAGFLFRRTVTRA